MTNETQNTGMRFYQSANADANTIRDNFIIRREEYGVIIDDIKRNEMKGSVQHYLLLGRRGSGKSTLLKRIQVEIDNNEQLRQKYIAINLAEEQANIYRLFDLLEEIIHEFDQRKIVVEHPEWDDDNNNYAQELFKAIHNAIEQSGKKVVLLLDNIDRIFENIKDDAGLLREMLLNYDDIRIIGGSTRMTEHFWKYDQPFYEFFRVLKLKALVTEEVKNLLLLWSEKNDLEALKEFVENKPGQLETVRILTDGLPRTLQFFVDIIINKKQETGYDYLTQLIDKISPLYQERLNTLPPAQRKVILQLAFFWEAVGTKELSVAARMNNKVVSAQLKQLTDKGIVEKIETSNKNHLYRIAERFFNLWLIFTQGSPREKRKARYLTIFLENFYSEDELKKLAEDHLQSLYECKIPVHKAALLTKAFAQSKYISDSTRDALINKTLELKDIDQELQKHMPLTTNKIWEEINELVKREAWEKALQEANNLEQAGGKKEMLMGYIYERKQEYANAEKHYLSATRMNIDLAYFLLGITLYEQSKFDLAEKYLLIATQKGIEDSNYWLAKTYHSKKEKESAEKYYLRSAEIGDSEGILGLAIFYDEMEMVDLAEKKYLLAIKEDKKEALFRLAYLYEKEKKVDLAEKYYLDSIKSGDKDSLYFLASLYQDNKKFDLAEKYYKIAIQENDYGAMLELGIMYYELGIKKEEALQLITKASEFEQEELLAEIAINAWNGKMNRTKDLLFNLIKKGTEDTIVALYELLVHYQSNLVYKIFLDKEFGEKLMEKYRPIYYAAALISGQEANIELKIPPELEDVVKEIVNEIETRHAFYYKTENK